MDEQLLSWKSPLGVKRQTISAKAQYFLQYYMSAQQNVASEQGIHCLQIV